MKKYVTVQNGSGMELNLPQLDPGYQWKIAAEAGYDDEFSWEMSIVNSRQETVYSEQLEARDINGPLVEDVEDAAEKLAGKFGFYIIDQDSDEEETDLSRYRSFVGVYA